MKNNCLFGIYFIFSTWSKHTLGLLCSIFFLKFDLFWKISVVTQYNIAQHNIMHLGNKVYNFSLVFSQCFDEYFM